jgi:amino acid transporter
MSEEPAVSSSAGMPIKRHKISLFSATALSATAMVGSGWLFSAQLNAKLAGNYAFLAWVLAALLVMAVGLCISQVVGVYPVRGAITRSSSLSHNNVFGMPFAFANWFGIMVTIATEAQATTQYLSAALKSTVLMGDDGLTVQGKLLALFILVIYLVINYYGIKLLARVNNVITVLKIFTPLFTIGMLMIAHFDTSNFSLTGAGSGNYNTASALAAIVGAGLIYSYNGFQISAAFASEIKNPERNVPLSIVLSIIIVMVVYILLQVAFMGAVPHQILAGGWASLNFHSPLMNLALLLGINFLALLLVADSVVSPSGTGYSYLGSASRMLYAMAAERQMPAWFAKLDPVYNFSKRSMLINFVLAALVLWNSKSWASLMVVVTGYHLIGYMAAPISMGAIKPKTRIFGFILFICLGLTMTTLPLHDLLMMNVSIIILMVIYGCVQVVTRGTKLSTLFSLNLPFLAYLWAIYFYQNLIFVGIISALFFLCITCRAYVDYCKIHKSEAADGLSDVKKHPGALLE